MTKGELITAIAEKTDLTKKDTDVILSAFFDTVKDVMSRGEKIQLIGFGTFEVVERAERVGRNPHTGEELVIPASKSPKLKFGKAMKDAIN